MEENVHNLPVFSWQNVSWRCAHFAMNIYDLVLKFPDFHGNGKQPHSLSVDLISGTKSIC